MFPVTRSNQITVTYYEALKEMNNPYAIRMTRHNGSHVYYTYHLTSVR